MDSSVFVLQMVIQIDKALDHQITPITSPTTTTTTTTSITTSARSHTQTHTITNTHTITHNHKRARPKGQLSASGGGEARRRRGWPRHQHQRCGNDSPAQHCCCACARPWGLQAAAWLSQRGGAGTRTRQTMQTSGGSCGESGVVKTLASWVGLAAARCHGWQHCLEQKSAAWHCHHRSHDSRCCWCCWWWCCCCWETKTRKSGLLLQQRGHSCEHVPCWLGLAACPQSECQTCAVRHAQHEFG